MPLGSRTSYTLALNLSFGKLSQPITELNSYIEKGRILRGGHWVHFEHALLYDSVTITPYTMNNQFWASTKFSKVQLNVIHECQEQYLSLQRLHC